MVPDLIDGAEPQHEGPPSPETLGRPSAWTLQVGDHRGHHGTLAALANGVIGVVGDVGPDPVGSRATFVAGAYGVAADGMVRPLPGPAWTAIGGDPPGTAWALDLRDGLLSRIDRRGRTTAARLVSVVRPTIGVLWAAGDVGGGWPAPLAPPDVPRALCADHTCEISSGGDGTDTAVVRGGREVVVATASQQVRRPHRMERIVSMARGPGAEGTARDALDEAVALGVDGLVAEHRAAWTSRWEDADIEIVGDPEAQLAIRFALFHLLSCAAPGDESPVGARGLTGLAYAGHVFWDTDVYILPALAAVAPAAARSILEYRIRRLPAARARARTGGLAGARFPWESADSGEDVTPRFGRDMHGEVVPITTGQLAEHITSDVAWAAVHYLDWTGDPSFLASGGRDLIVDTASYWMDRSQLDEWGLAHVYDVTGPDEYHECVDDDAYTNLMVRWHLGQAAHLVAAEGDDERASALRRRAAALVVGRRAGGRHEQFAGFDQLEAVDLADLGPTPVAADIVLGRARTVRSKVLKQPDVLMAHHLLPTAFSPAELQADLDGELPLICHGSSLSPAVCAAVLARAGRADEALELFRLASRIDLDDLTGSTSSGLHLATMGGIWQAVVFGFVGVIPGGRTLQVDPHLPTSWESVRVRFRHQGVLVELHVDHRTVSVEAEEPIPVRVQGVQLTAPVSQAIRHDHLRDQRAEMTS
ncbi:MAG TPA: glycosyl hydrolase family 65 protein [Acidimicrobiales bacterium]|nr:glycosyl hydrolase family 65 protein [Acidimicrobiales bacterium]